MWEWIAQVVGEVVIVFVIGNRLESMDSTIRDVLLAFFGLAQI